MRGEAPRTLGFGVKPLRGMEAISIHPMTARTLNILQFQATARRASLLHNRATRNTPLGAEFHRMPRFSLRRLLVAITYIVLGAGVFSAVGQSGVAVLDYPLILVPLVGSGALIGAGILHPFRRAWLGAAIGAGGMIGLLFYVIFTTEI